MPMYRAQKGSLPFHSTMKGHEGISFSSFVLLLVYLSFTLTLLQPYSSFPSLLSPPHPWGILPATTLLPPRIGVPQLPANPFPQKEAVVDEATPLP